MVNHWLDEAPPATRCGEYEGSLAAAVSSNARVSCPECRDLLTPAEREGQWYPFEKPTWSSIFGIAPDFTGGMDIDEYLTESRGEA